MQKNEKSFKRFRIAEKNLRASMDELTALDEVSRSITSSAKLDRMLSLIVKKVTHLIRGDVCTMHLLDGSGGLVLKTSYGLRDMVRGPRVNILRKGGMVSRIVRTKKAAILRSLGEDAEAIFSGSTGTKALRSFILVPLVERG